MRKLSSLYILFFSLIFTVRAQNLQYCKANLQWQNAKGGEKKSDAKLTFDKASQELIIDISLLPLIANQGLRDSLQKENSPFHLFIKGQFPINQPEYFSASENEKQVSMDARIQLGDSLISQTITLVLTMIRDKGNAAPSGMEASVLPCRANFALLIDPKRFGLNKPPLKWIQKFIVDVQNGVINRR